MKKILLKAILILSKKQLSEEDFVDLFKLNEEERRYLFLLVIKNKIVSIVYQNILKYDLKNLFLYDHLQVLRILYLNIRIKDKEYREEAKKIVILLNEMQVEYCIIKGISLQDRLYSEWENVFRDFNDIDFLTLKCNYKYFDEILKELGYRQGNYDLNGNFIYTDRREILQWKLSTHQTKEYIKKRKNFDLSTKEVFGIDVNHTIFWGGIKDDYISMTEILKNRNYVLLDKDTVYPVLNYEYEIIQLCFHFYKDTIYESKKKEGTYRLIGLLDIYLYLILYNNKIDFYNLTYILKEYNLLEKVGSILLVVCNLWKDEGLNSLYLMLKKECKSSEEFISSICFQLTEL